MYTVKELSATASRKTLKMTCEYCGSEDVGIRMFCVWNKELQRWIGEDHDDYEYCNRCDNETTVNSVEI